MPSSDGRGKAEAQRWIAQTFSPGASALDIGAGAGFWGITLKRVGFDVVDGVEIWEPYIDMFGLKSIYSRVFLSDARAFVPDRKYDLVVFSDVLEHMTPHDSWILLASTLRFSKYALVSLPWMYPQGPHAGNPYESHLQPDLTRAIAEMFFKPSGWLFCDDSIGVFYVESPL